MKTSFDSVVIEPLVDLAIFVRNGNDSLGKRRRLRSHIDGNNSVN